MKFALVLLLAAFAARGEKIDLSGKWDLQLDTAASQEIPHWSNTQSIHLPGTLSEAKEGQPLTVQPGLPPPTVERLNLARGLLFNRPKNYSNDNTSLMHLYQRFSYVGPAWYRRTVEIPSNWKDKDVELFLERVIWQTKVWVNGQWMGSQNSLVAPHRYEIGSALKPGRNEIVIRVDNSRQAAIGNPHAYTDESQTIWNGIIGRIELIARDKSGIDHLELRPDLAGRRVEVTANFYNGGTEPLAAELRLQASPANFAGRPMAPLRFSVSIPPGASRQTFHYPVDAGAQLWSEFNPKLYRMTARLHGRALETAASDQFGWRQFRRDGRIFEINSQPVFLRGTVECCVFPKTGYPGMTGRQWQKIFSTVKKCGLNHLRFHTWCPPEATFEMADKAGIYLEVELPNWSFQIGKDPAATRFLRDEGERMIREYGNHPSWVMFTMGNELKGDYRVLDNLVDYFRSLDSTLLFASTTYPSSKRGKVPGPEDDYYISQDTQCGRVRGQDVLNDTPPNTVSNFSKNASCLDVPLVSHEVGQYCVYPGLAELPQYDGVLRNTAFEAIRGDLQAKGRLDEARQYTRDSGRLAALLYKEEVERALRTTNQAGFQLLQLNDFPGQGTSTVGLFDSFWDDKGVISPREFRRFCGPVVPLLELPKRVFENSESLDAAVEIANFGPSALRNGAVRWTIQNGRHTLAAGLLRAAEIPRGERPILGAIHQSLASVTQAARLKVTVAIEGTRAANDWFIWVYPRTEKSSDDHSIDIFENASPAFYDALDHGRRVLLLPRAPSILHPLAVQFTTVFWNPVMFPNQPGTMGALIDRRHPIFQRFPTDEWSDWQWWELLHRAVAMDLTGVAPAPPAPLRFIDKFNRNALPAAIMEARAGRGRLLICSLDISQDLNHRIAARQLRRSILSYMESDAFHPKARLSFDDLKRLLRAAQ